MAADIAADLALARAVAAGEPGALERLWELYGGRLLRFALYEVCGNRDDAQDVVQETLIGAVRTMDRYQGESSLYNWLCGVARNKAADCRRRQARQIQIEQQAAEEQRQNRRVAEWSLAPERRLTRAETVAQARELLEQLPEHYRQALELKYIEGLRVPQIAQRMGMTFKACESTLTRAREALRAASEGGELEWRPVAERQEARRQQVRELMTRRPRPATEIARLLGYSDSQVLHDMHVLGLNPTRRQSDGLPEMQAQAGA